MKIVGFDPDNTNEEKIAFVTEPPLTKEVFDIYSKTVTGNMFSFRDGLLVAAQSFGIDKQYLDQTEEHLSEAERHIQGNRTRREKQQKDLLDRISKQTGRPIIKRPGS